MRALYHRLAMSSIRYPEIPAYFDFEAQKVTNELDLWERWVEVRETEDGFQEWLSGDFGGQPQEDENGNPIPGSAKPDGRKRREVLVWNKAELEAELEVELAT